MSDSTKYALARSLKKVLEKKSLDKITITDITDDCGVNRQTFYYHFHDIYELIEWMYITVANRAIGDNRTYRTWQEGMEDIMKAMLDDRDFLLKTYHSKSGGHLADILLKKTFELLTGVINEVSLGYPIREDDKKFISDFYKYAFSGIIMQWVDSGMKASPESIVSDFDCIMNGNIRSAVRNFSTQAG